MKTVNFQCIYEVPEEYSYVARNQNGSLVGFIHAPVRDASIGEWIDCVDGSSGTIIPYGKWDTSVREVSDLTDISKTFIGRVKSRQAYANAEVLRKKMKEGK
jgi:hypothetical protein